MQIADLARQYIKSTTSKDNIGGTRAVEKLVSSIRDMTAGNVFEGTVNSISGGKVVLGLSNGRELTARLDANIQLVQGQSMFFQVKSNDGAAIAIRPYTVDGAGVNLTLLNALKAANLPATEQFLSMANAMMQEQMPIDKNSMANMARILMANPDMSVNTLIQMKKLDIPINSEMIAQFENYVDDNSAVHKALDSFITELPATLAGKDMPIDQLKAFDSQFLAILAEGMEEISQMTLEAENEKDVATQKTNVGAEVNGTAVQEGGDAQTVQTPQTVAGKMAEMVANGNADAVPAGTDTVITNALAEEIDADQTTMTGKKDGVEDAAETEVKTASEQGAKADEQAIVSNQKKEAVRALIQQLFGEHTIKASDSSAVLLQKLSNMILSGELISKEALNKLFSSKDMQEFLRGVLEEQMYLRPEDVADGEEVKKLYERLESKTQQLETLLMNAKLNETSLAQTVADVRGNIDFMNQLNQTYTYVQIPLKMRGQNASGQLYVYTNKRDLGDEDKDLTAFLHLDMDNLGSTDVSVRMRKKDVDTKFYMESDEAYALIKAHMPELEERLRKKGFNAKIYVENEGKKVDFVEDFLKKDAPSAGQLHRYSFDVRA